MQRYRTLSLAGATAFVAWLGAVGTASAQTALTVAYYGGNWGEAIQACVVEPFVKATGIKVTPEPGTSTVTTTKLRQQKGNPAIDVAWIDGGISEVAAQEGLVAALDPKRIPNIGGMEPAGVYRNARGEIFALSTGFYALGIAYNTQKVKQPPTSWFDLWRPEYRDAVTIPSPANAGGVPFIAVLAKLTGGSLAKPQPAFAKIKELKAAAFFDSSGQASNLFQSGEAVIGAHYATGAWGLADGKFPVSFVVPKEGAIAGDIRVHVVNGTKKAAAAEKFVNFAVAREPAACLSDKLYLGPATKDVTPGAKARERMPWGKQGSLANLIILDWNEVNAQRTAIQDQWNREIARK